MDIKGKRGFYLCRKTKKEERGESHQQEKEKEDESRFSDMSKEPFFFFFPNVFINNQK